jgi:hypothetical protein
METMTYENQAAKLVLIQKLLAKAEGGATPEEAESLIGKAQELMSRFSIDEAMLASTNPRGAKPISINFIVPGPFAKAKTTLLGAIAKNNSCRVVQNRKLDSGSLRVWVFGFESDVNAVQAMFTTLSIVSTKEMIHARRLHPEVHGKSFAQSFILGFAYKINLRLAEMNRSVVSSYGTGTALVLRDRSSLVEDAMKNEFGRLVKGQGLNNSSMAGNHAGNLAGSRANLNSSVNSSARAAIG